MTPDPRAALLVEGATTPTPAPATNAKPRSVRHVAPRLKRTSPRREAERTAQRRTGPGRSVRAPRRRKAGKAATRKPAGPAPATGPQRDVARLLDGLHASWWDAMEAHRLRVEGQFHAAEAAVRTGKRRKAKDWERARSALKVRVKPRKGRAKDLRRVEAALDQVLARVGSE